MYYLYYLCCPNSESVYIGFTNNLKRRLTTHKHQARKGRKSPLYDSMRKYGLESYTILPFRSFTERQEALRYEREAISLHRTLGAKLLNLAEGGEGGFVVPEGKIEVWKNKLSKARQGRKPALGMKHSDKNKECFSECAKRKPLRFPDLDPTIISFRDAKEKFGVSKTHYYRLLKQKI